MKTIYDYFDNKISYPQDICDNILPYNIVWSEVPTTLLDGFINHVTPLVCFVLDSYVGIDEQIEENRAHVSLKNDRFNYYYFKGTKRELIKGINSGVIQITHTKFHLFGDDIVILSKIADKKYMFFWYHMSGRCDIGRILTDRSEAELIKSLKTWLHNMKSDDNIKGFHELKIENFIEGWCSF